MPISALQLYKALPQTNCRECGFPTCLAFATQVVVEGLDLAGCPYLSPEVQSLADDIKNQQENGVGRKRDNFAIALKFLQEKVEPLDFAALAAGLGATFGQDNGRPALTLPYFGRPVQVFKNEVRYPAKTQENPWDAILLYNYIASQGQRPPCGQWIKFQGLPNSVSKTKTLLRLQKHLAEAFSGNSARLAEKARQLGGEPVQVAQDAEVQFLFQPLPRLPLLLVFHEVEPEENFDAEAHFLFDAQVMDFLDLESLLFLVERLMDQLMEKYD